MELDTDAHNDYIAALFAPQDAALTETLAEMERETFAVSTFRGPRANCFTSSPSWSGRSGL